jgi:hypothetical protein
LFSLSTSYTDWDSSILCYYLKSVFFYIRIHSQQFQAFIYCI